MSDSRDIQQHEQDSNGALSVVISIVFTIIAAFFLVLRMITRYGIVRNFGPEDWLIIAALVTSVALTACIGMEVHYGQGHHADTISSDNIIRILQVR